jgi:hypothetical protein
MRQSIDQLRYLFHPAVLTILGLGSVGGCTADFGGFPSGAYSGAPTCVLEVTGPTGATGQETFTEDLTVTIDLKDAFTINGVPVEIGAQHLRSLPTADLAFEVVAVQQSAGSLEITYEPRPTLPGIEITGSLVESYLLRNGDIAVNAQAELIVNDADGANTFTIECDEALLVREPTP